MSAATTVSRITGYLRTMVMAATLGSGVVANAYTLSNTLPNQIYELFMGGILYSIFIPLLVERIQKHGEEDARRFTDALFTLVVPVLAAVSLLGVLFAGPLVRLASDFEAAEGNLSPEEARQATELAILMFRIFAVQIIFYGIGAVCIGVLNSHRRFFLPTFAPVFNNLVVIASFAGYWLLREENPAGAVYVLAGGTTLGVAVMSLVLLPPVIRLGYRPRPRLGHPALRSAARLAGPMLVFVAAAVGVQFAANLIGSQFGAVEYLWYAFMIYSLPYGIFVVAIATALMPELSERFSASDAEGYRRTLSFGLRIMAFIVVPATVGLITLSEPIVGLLYERGEFTPQDTRTVSALLVAYAAGLLGYATYFILARAFYARQNTKTPAAMNVFLLALYVALAYGLSRILGAQGIAWAFSAAYFVLALALLLAMRRETKSIDGRRLLNSLIRILLAGAAMFATAHLGMQILGPGSDFAQRAAILAGVGGASVAVYLGAALALRVQELRSGLSLLRGRLQPPSR
nr:murein biosynthesis integral membrane protein MurJ [Rubrobacter taiwanensis]